ncbi:hypothetical protein [uncultured Parabacteroides sp.]|uniref:hypothetical protein n=1 Tax=uncultured Parabacteroides sp. TaxID=512312 RepID=UPI0026129736|nr:hypothetical protein [uncultured Parabacteroides sp.]
MNDFLLIKRNRRAAPLRLAARIISIMILAFLWPARGGAQTGGGLSDLDVSNSNINGKLTLTYKLKAESSTDYAWFYKIGTDGSDTEFSGTLTGTNNSWSQGAIDIKSEKKIEDSNNNMLDTYPILQLKELNLTYNANDSLLYMVEGGEPLCIQATGSSASTLKCQGVVINNNGGCDLLLDGGAAGLNILGKKSNGIYLYTTGHPVGLILKGKIDIVADNKYAVSIGNSASLSAAEDAKITASAGLKAILDNNVHSPFLEWRFNSSAPESGKTLEIKDANGKSLNPAIQFTTDDKNRHFAVNVKKDIGYTVWLDDNLLMDEKKTTVFTATENKLFSFEKMQFPSDWPTYGQTVSVGPGGTDVSVSGTTYTVKTPRGLAWIAWVTNNGKTANTTNNTTNTGDAYYPTNAGFKDCTVKLANDISLATPTKGVATGFRNNWMPIGTSSSKSFQGTFDGNHKTITGMAIDSTSVNYIGLFGYLNGATVQDLTMADEGTSPAINLGTSTSTDSAAGDNYYLGSVAGWVNSGKIINCHNKCAVSFSMSDKVGNVGGFAGMIAENSVVSACSNSGAITVDGSPVMGGGIAGESAQSSIVSCFNTGDVSATGNTNTAYAGGIVGDGNINGDSSTPSHISYCYSTGDITAKTATTSTSGGIVGGARYAVIESCFATGSVSAESSSNSGYPTNYAYAGGIIGWIWSGSVTVQDCLALNTDGVKATISTSEKHAGRIAGNNNNATLSSNYASVNIKLTVGDNTAAPTTGIAVDAINGANVYLDEVADVIAGWTGEGKAFTAIDTTKNGKLPRLKKIASFGNDGRPETYDESDFIPGQPDDLTSSTYLPYPDPLSLSSDDTDLTLSCSNGKWSYKKGEDGVSTRFDGTVKMANGASPSTNKLSISAAIGNPTLTFDKVKIKPTGAAALTIGSGCALILNTTGEGTSTLSASGASTFVNKGSVTLTGKGLYIGNTDDNNEYYGLDNSGSFTVADPSSTSVTFHCANAAIHNTGTLGNAWMEWQFAATTAQNDGNGTNDAPIAFAATDAADPFPAARLRQGKTFATTVTAGKTYRLWTVTKDGADNGTEVRTRQQGLTAATPAEPVVYFQAPADNGVAAFTGVKAAIPVAVTQPAQGGGTISVFSGDSLLAKADTIPNGVKLALKYYPLPGYELKDVTITPTPGENNTNTNPPTEYTVPTDATAVTITAAFKAKTVEPADTTQTVVVADVSKLPSTPVEKPTAVIDKDKTTASTGSEVKLITGALEDEHQESVKATFEEVAADIAKDNIIFAEIALVEITTTSGSSQTTMTPIQPKDGNKVHVVYPYPSGTNSNDSFVIVHLKTDGTTEVYRDAPDTGKGEKELQKTARGLEFDVDSFSPFGIAWIKTYTPPPYVPPVTNYYTVTLPDVEGVTFSKKAGAYTVEEGYSFSFALVLQEGYELHSKPVVRTSRGEILEPRASDGKYVVRFVEEDITVAVEGIVRNDDQPTANAAIASDTRVWAAEGRLHLSLDSPACVCIVDMGGRVCLLFDAPAGETTRPLRPGLYLVRLGEKEVFKVAVR